MKWQIPAKTFLLGEYAAVAQASAIVLTTTPYFELTLTTQGGLQGIHPDSPAGRFWLQHEHGDSGLVWYDPYQGIGGLGASSAQFLACYLAHCHLADLKPNVESMLDDYYQVSWSGKGLRPSGYDVIAQYQHGCVFINQNQGIKQSYAWPFTNLSFILVHTGVKLATHHHLEKTALPHSIAALSQLTDQAREAFETINHEQLIAAVNQYHQALHALELVAQHTLECIEKLKAHPDILAIKGCGALGADIILLLTTAEKSQPLQSKLRAENWTVLGSDHTVAQ